MDLSLELVLLAGTFSGNQDIRKQLGEINRLDALWVESFAKPAIDMREEGKPIQLTAELSDRNTTLSSEMDQAISSLDLAIVKRLEAYISMNKAIAHLATVLAGSDHIGSAGLWRIACLAGH